MALQFNDTTNYQGLVQLAERELKLPRTEISGNTAKLKDFAADANLAWDSYLHIAFSSSGTWQFDDSNQTDYPIIKTNLVDGQKDYTLTTDESGNLILDVYKVAILRSATATLYDELRPMDQQSDREAYNLVAENTTEGVPYQYDKTANAIILDPIPSYNATNGLKVYINREASSFAYTDTTKKPGCPGLHHRYFALKPALDYARRNGLTQEASLRNEVQLLEESIAQYFARRSRDERHRITARPVNFR